MALTGNDKTTRKQFRACGLFYFVCFTRQKRLVDLYPAVDDRRVRTYLITRAQQNNIVPDKFFGRNSFQSPVANNLRVGSVQQIHLVKSLFCAYTLKDTYQRVADDYRQKRQIPVRADNRQKHGDYKKYQVKICKYIRADYFFC